VEIRDSVVVVTGASSGIGRATALGLAKRGATVVLVARSEADLEIVATGCRAVGGQASVVACDLVDPEAPRRVVDHAIATHGALDVWVNNAAVMAYGRFDRVPERVHRRVIETNLVGPMAAACAVLPHFVDQRHGVLVNVASLYGDITTPLVAAYSTSKFGLVGFSEVLRRDLRDVDGVRVSTILPASVDTPIFRHAANYTGQRVRPVPPVMRPEKVVEAIAKAIEEDHAELVVGRAGQLFAVGQRLFPWVYDRLVGTAMQVGGLSDEEAEDGTGNVFEPMTEWNRTTGDWRDGTQRVAALAAAAIGVAVVGAVVARRR
jgi:short-subunit dehydrogenase